MTDRHNETASEPESVEGVGPEARRRLLGLRLSALRAKSGLTAEEAGNRAGVSKATVSRYERGKGSIRWTYVDQLCRVYGTSDAEREALSDLAKHSKQTDAWWVPYAGKLSDNMRLLLAMENEASRIHHLGVGVVPGLLQTMEYARSIRTTPDPGLSAGDVDEYLSVRMQRQQIFDRAQPPTYRAVLDEAVLHRLVGGSEVMTDQLSYLLKRAQDPGITIQVLPLTAGAYVAALSPFIRYGGTNPDLDVIYLENAVGSLFLDDATARKTYADGFAFLCREALDPASSAGLIAEVLTSHRNRT
ncbi:helix-turn-helix domain-containing protein [Streptomyces sp. NPDC056244]|uniref:helix-turn-helix domain-containing protein n=1 Tax=Streptomyces sp. NPDC056244 TaxID=3345762 RepID=UPI0035E10181